MEAWIEHERQFLEQPITHQNSEPENFVDDIDINLNLKIAVILATETTFERYISETGLLVA